MSLDPERPSEVAKWRELYQLMATALDGIGRALGMDPQGLLEDPSSAALAIRNARVDERQQAAQFAVDCIANGVVVLSAGEVGAAILNREPTP
jgi:hypothetical protein